MASISLDLSGGSGSVECQANFNFQVSLVYFPTLAITCKNKMGYSIKHKILDILTKQLSEWCTNRQVRVSLGRRAGKDSIEADF